MAWLQEKTLGISRQRSLPTWHSKPFNDHEIESNHNQSGTDVLLIADTFNRWFEPDNLRAAIAVLLAGGYRIKIASVEQDQRPLCCGRTFLASGLIDEARKEAQRMVDVLLPYAKRGIPILGLEPSCLYTLRDEFKVLIPGGHTDIISGQAMLVEEFLAREPKTGNLNLKLRPLSAKHALLHGHCHQKAFAAMDAVQTTLDLIPELTTELVEFKLLWYGRSIRLSIRTL